MLQGQQMLMPSPPPSLDKDSPAWSDDIGASPLDIRQRIFCNRSLNMASIQVSSSIKILPFSATVGRLDKLDGV